MRVTVVVLYPCITLFQFVWLISCFMALHCFGLHCINSHYIVSAHAILHGIVLYCILTHCIMLHFSQRYCFMFIKGQYMVYFKISYYITSH